MGNSQRKYLNIYLHSRFMELKETRKLLPRGKFTLDVSLPAWWIKAHELKSGSPVFLFVTPDKVIIKPVELEEQK